jgi:hypothetical protein
MKKSILLITSIFFTACDLDLNSDPIRPDHTFEVTIFDESGNTLNSIIHDSSAENANTNSIAVFGDDFIPDWVKERMNESDTWTPGNFYQDEIYLHTEIISDEDQSFSSFRLTLSNEIELTTDKYLFNSFSEEYFKDRLKHTWDCFYDDLENNCVDEFKKPNHYDNSEVLAILTFAQQGFFSDQRYGNQIAKDNYLAFTGNGYLEILNILEDQVEGVFESEIFAVSLEDVFYQDEFPEDIQIKRFTVIGSFTAKHGDWQDLIEFEKNPYGM